MKRKYIQNLIDWMNNPDRKPLMIEGAKTRDIVNPYFWLTTAQIILSSYCLKENITKPLMKENDALFRLYLSDVGLFSYQSGLNYDSFLKDKDNVLTGIYYENYIAMELTARGYGLFYWRGKRDAELEFIINYHDELIPIDAKKKKGSLSSLAEFRLHNANRICIKVSQNQCGFDKENGILTLPYYYFSFFLDHMDILLN